MHIIVYSAIRVSSTVFFIFFEGSAVGEEHPVERGVNLSMNRAIYVRNTAKTVAIGSGGRVL